jgi:hypothetical protein
MKTTLAIILLCAAMVNFSGCLMYQTVTFSESENVIKVYDNLSGTQDQLYLRSHEWMIATFNSAESVIQHADKAEGVIIGKYLMHGEMRTSQYGTADSRVYAIIDVRVKEGKARIEIKPQGSWQYDEGGMTIYNYSKSQAIADAQKIADNFYKYMTTVKKIDF